jgi:hypothetical protein
VVGAGQNGCYIHYSRHDQQVRPGDSGTLGCSQAELSSIGYSDVLKEARQPSDRVVRLLVGGNEHQAVCKFVGSLGSALSVSSKCCYDC